MEKTENTSSHGLTKLEYAAIHILAGLEENMDHPKEILAAKAIEMAIELFDQLENY